MAGLLNPWAIKARISRWRGVSRARAPPALGLRPAMTCGSRTTSPAARAGDGARERGHVGHGRLEQIAPAGHDSGGSVAMNRGIQ